MGTTYKELMNCINMPASFTSVQSLKNKFYFEWQGHEGMEYLQQDLWQVITVASFLTSLKFGIIKNRTDYDCVVSGDACPKDIQLVGKWHPKTAHTQALNHWDHLFFTNIGYSRYTQNGYACPNGAEITSLIKPDGTLNFAALDFERQANFWAWVLKPYLFTAENGELRSNLDIWVDPIIGQPFVDAYKFLKAALYLDPNSEVNKHYGHAHFNRKGAPRDLSLVEAY